MVLNEAPWTAWQRPDTRSAEPEPKEPTVNVEELVAKAYADGIEQGRADTQQAVGRVRAEMVASQERAMAVLDDAIRGWKTTAEQEVTKLTVRMWQDLLLGDLPDGVIEHRIRAIIEQVAGRQPESISGSIHDLEQIRTVLSDLGLGVEVRADAEMKRASLKVRLAEETVDADIENYLARLQEPLGAVDRS